MSMTTELLLSRNFVEFGPFSAEEITAFSTRGLLRDSDFVKDVAGETWVPLGEWLAAPAEPSAPPAPAPAKAKKKTAKAKTAA